MDEQLKSNLTSRRHWMRLVFMVLFAFLLQVASLVMWALVAVQFLWALITGSDNDKLRRFGQSLATYIFEALRFLTYNTEQKPFPFSDWPDLPAKREEIVEVEVVEPKPAAGTANATADDTGEEIVEETKEVVEEVKDQDEAGSKSPKKRTTRQTKNKPNSD